jgi:hypothetical protein
MRPPTRAAPWRPDRRRWSWRTRPDRAPGQAVSAEDYRAILLYAGDDTPLDGVEELIVALHDIAAVVSRPALARLAKIGGVAEEVATAEPAAHSPDKATGTIRKPASRTVQEG